MNLQEILRRFVRNATLIVGSRLVFGLLNLGTSAIVVRVFGLGDFGVVILLQSYARLFAEVIKLESWQAILSFGTGKFNTDRAGFTRLLGLTMGIDVLSALVGISGAILFAPWAAEIFEWPDEVTEFAPIFMISIPFMIHATPNGFLRLINRVDVLAWQQACSAIVRFIGVLIAWALDAGVMGVVLAWFSGAVLSGSLQFFFAFSELAKLNMMPLFRINLVDAAREFTGIWCFLAFSNLSSSLSVVYNSGATIFVGATLGAPAAAILQIAQQFANALSRPARLLSPIISPEFAQLASSGDWVLFKKLLYRQLGLATITMGLFATALFLLLGWILKLIYGEVVLTDITLFQLLVLNAVITMIAFSLEPALLSAFKAGTLFLMRFAASVAFIIVVFLGIERMGVVSVGFASLAAQAVYISLFVVIGGRLLRNRLRSV